MSPERIDELIALAALGELSPEDECEIEVQRHADPSFAAELDEALATAAALQRVHAEQPPVGLRADVMTAIAGTPQERTPDSDHPVVALDTARSRRRHMPALLLAAAAVVVFVVGAFIVSNEASAPDQYEAIIEASDAEAHQLSGELGTLTAVYSPSHAAMVVTGDGIAAVAGTYQVWFDVDGHMEPAGLFRPDDDGHVEVRLAVADGIGASVNVTAEPAGGSEEPTLPVLATSS